MREAMIKDPVCGMRMTPEEAVHVSEYAGVVHRFCSEACKAKFDREPAKYASMRSGR
jgi:YHS domain-containing protein